MKPLLMVLGILAATPPAPGWELVGQAGALKMVYVEPAGVKNTKVLSTIVAQMLDRFGTQRPMQIDFFDDRAQTPATRPYAAEQRLHHRAKFNFNPKNGMRRFVWVQHTPDPNNPAVLRFTEREETLPSP